MPEITEKFLNELKWMHYAVVHPDGTLEPTRQYEHEYVFKRYFESRVQEFEDRMSDECQEYADSIPEGEHPEWHCFEMHEDRERHRFMEKLYDDAYDLGFVRLGLFRRDGELVVEAEGFKHALDKHRALVNDIAVMLVAEVMFTERKKNGS